MSSKISMFNIFDNNDFSDGFLDWMRSPEGILIDQIREVTWEMMELTTVDAKNQQILWEEGQRLGITQSAERIYETIEPGQGVTIEHIEREVIGWLEMEYEPENNSPADIKKYERAVSRWIKNDKRKK